MILVEKYNFKDVFLLGFSLLFSLQVLGQKAYFADGYHGGIYGHYPDGQTQFMVDMLYKYPDWKINIEIEPPTWDSVEKNFPKAYRKFKKIFKDQSMQGRIEYVNPTYAQSYLWNISGESIIRQFSYGMKELKSHFPNIVFDTYSSEEPCFTSCLPQILKSFGIENAVLKNPNTCWGGYTTAFGGELVNWIGPDGTNLYTVPRYACEALQPGSTWQTIAWDNSKDYIQACFEQGIQAPVGMTYQDAMWSGGWDKGPWLGGVDSHSYEPSDYIIWRKYFSDIAKASSAMDWRFSQEDVRVSLMWGSQVLQRIAQEVRVAENKVIAAERVAVLQRIYSGHSWPQKVLDNAWESLLLSQHHDCWITPYNHSFHSDKTWFEHVSDWTNNTIHKSDSLIKRPLSSGEAVKPTVQYIRVYNGFGKERNELVQIELPDYWKGQAVSVVDRKGSILPTQRVKDKLMFMADVPSFGYNTYRLERKKESDILEASGGAKIVKQKDGSYLMETDYYQLLIDPSHGGKIKSLIAKKLNDKEFVDTSSIFGFNELRGYFYNKKDFFSSTDHPAKVSIEEKDLLHIVLKIEGTIASQKFIQFIGLTQSSPLIDMKVRLDWDGNPGIGAYGHPDKWESYRKGFYNDRYKLLTLFPTGLKGQLVYKDAPFDVTKSRLQNTFFNTWDSIKNNIILHWVDITDKNKMYGLALFSDHTTSYTHGESFPLGLDLQYSGHGLWGANYTIDGSSEIKYAIMPHVGDWEEGAVSKVNSLWNEPLQVVFLPKKTIKNYRRSLVQIQSQGVRISAAGFKGNDLWLRFYNESSISGKKSIVVNKDIKEASIIQLNRIKLKTIPVYGSHLKFYMPQFGIKTILLKGVIN